MKGSPMRSLTGKHSSLFRWLLLGALPLGSTWLVACAADETPPESNGPNNQVMCVAPEVDCSGLCANPTSNALHCGGCGRPCLSGQICENSACVMGSCAMGTDLCNGACVNLQTDARNCSACGAACPTGQTCQAGGCVGGGNGGSGGTSGTGGGTTGGTGGTGTGGATTGGTGGGAGTGGAATGGTGGAMTGGAGGGAGTG